MGIYYLWDDAKYSLCPEKTFGFFKAVLPGILRQYGEVAAPKLKNRIEDCARELEGAVDPRSAYRALRSFNKCLIDWRGLGETRHLENLYLWERGGSPMNLLPAYIANMYAVSIARLMGLDGDEEKNKMSQILKSVIDSPSVAINGEDFLPSFRCPDFNEYLGIYGNR
jgi:hypothetical protein